MYYRFLYDKINANGELELRYKQPVQYYHENGVYGSYFHENRVHRQPLEIKEYEKGYPPMTLYSFTEHEIHREYLKIVYGGECPGGGFFASQIISVYRFISSLKTPEASEVRIYYAVEQRR